MKTVLITGATDGIGLQTAKELYNRGFWVLIHGRSLEKSKAAASKISSGAKDRVEYVAADFSSLSDVKAMTLEIISRFQKLDVLINNAGVFMNSFELSKDGFELTFAVNHLAHFVLTLHLLPMVEKAGNGRIINVSSMAHSSSLDIEQINNKRTYSPFGAYGDSKLCNILFTNQLARLAGNRFSVNALHPGVITTKLLKAGFGMGGAPLEKGAETPVFLATIKDTENVTGKYFANMKERPSAGVAYDENLQRELWDKSIAWTKPFLPDLNQSWLDPTAAQA